MPDPAKTGIRTARPQDFDILAEMYKAHRKYHETRGHGGRVPLDKRLEQLRSYITAPEWLVLIDVWEDLPAGYALATMWRGEKFRGRGYLADIFIMREHRRRGTGSALLESVEKWLIEKGAQGLVTEVDSGNVAALAFFRRNGYRWAKHYGGPLGAFQDAIEDREMTTGELSKFLRLVPEDQLPDRLFVVKGGPLVGEL